MRSLQSLALAGALTLLALVTSGCNEKSPQPIHSAPRGMPTCCELVSDGAHVLERKQVSELTRQLETIKRTTGITMVVAFVPSLEGLSIDDYANQMFKAWGIGGKANKGLLLLVAPTERRVRLETGYGMEGSLPDAQVKRIITGVAPYYKTLRWYEGTQYVLNAVNRS